MWQNWNLHLNSRSIVFHLVFFIFHFACDVFWLCFTSRVFFLLWKVHKFNWLLAQTPLHLHFFLPHSLHLLFQCWAFIAFLNIDRCCVHYQSCIFIGNLNLAPLHTTSQPLQEANKIELMRSKRTQSVIIYWIPSQIFMHFFQYIPHSLEHKIDVQIWSLSHNPPPTLYLNAKKIPNESNRLLKLPRLLQKFTKQPFNN